MNNAVHKTTWRSVMSMAALSSLLTGGPGIGAWATSAGPDALLPLSAPPSLAAPDTLSRARAAETLGKLPLIFEENRGQTDSSVRFLSRGDGYSLFLTPTEAVLALRQPAAGREEATMETRSATPNPRSLVLRMRLPGSNPDARITGRNPLPGKSNYFVGNDPGKWQKDVPTYAKVHYEDIYPGVDLVYYGNQRQLEYDFIVAPGTDPEAIRLSFAGADKVEVDAQGDLVLHTPAGQMRQRKPFIYQDVDGGKQAIAGRYILRASPHPSHPTQPTTPIVSFEVAAYDTTRPLIIDPVLAYSTYLGGSGSEGISDIAVDPAGNIYVTGGTTSTDFPTPDASTWNGDITSFVIKLNAAGSALIYSTFLPRLDTFELPSRIAVDGAGDAYLVGAADSTEFPTLRAFQSVNAGRDDGVVVKLGPTGVLLYSTYLGGAGTDIGTGIAVDALENAYVTGSTGSTDFPTRNALQPVASLSGNVFIAKLDTTAAGDASLVYSTYLGGSSLDAGNSIAVDEFRNIYVAGITASSDFPTVNAFQSTLKPSPEFPLDIFVAKLNAAGSAVLYSTYLGGSGKDRISSMVIDASGSVYVTGEAEPGFDTSGPMALDFPTTPGVFGPSVRFVTSCFITKLALSGSALVYSSLYDARCMDIAVDPAGNAYLTGGTIGNGLPPQVNPLPESRQCSTAGDAFVTKINPDASAVVYATWLTTRGNLGESGRAIAVDAAGTAHVAGTLGAEGVPPTGALVSFPTTPDALQPTFNGGSNDDFIVKIADPDPASLTDSPGAEITSTISGGGLTLAFSTLLGPSFVTDAKAIAVDTDGNVYVTGDTESSVFPVTPGAVQATCSSCSADRDVFITKLNASGTALVYSTYVGGSRDDLSRGIAVDAAGNTYVTGEVFSPDFPVTPGVVQPTFGGGSSFFPQDAFVTKLNTTGTAFVYSSYLGGSGDDGGSDIAVDAAGNAYVTGFAEAGFPTTGGALQSTFAGGSQDAFVTKLNATGTAFVYSSYLGGSESDVGRGIVVDAAGNAYVTGAAAEGFPTTAGAFQPAFAGGSQDAFVTKLDPTGAMLAYSTYLGGSRSEISRAIAVDSVGNAYVTGSVFASDDFPITPGAFQVTRNPAGYGVNDAFVTKLNANGTALLYSTYLGGAEHNDANGIAVDAVGNAYITGTTGSSDFPTVNALQPTFAGGRCEFGDAFLSQLNPTGSALGYSTYLGGGGNDSGVAIATDTTGNAYMTGVAGLAFPTTPGAFQTMPNQNALFPATTFISKLSFDVAAAPDPFLCYSVSQAKAPGGVPPYPKFVRRDGVFVIDAFGAASSDPNEQHKLDLLKPTALCAPALLPGGDPGAPAHAAHLEGYAAKLTPTRPPQPKFAKRNVRVQNQLGALVLTALGVDSLWVPSSKADGVGAAPPLGADSLKHFECYDAAVAKAPPGTPSFPVFTPVSVSVTDGLGGTKLFSLTKPSKLCNPADKNGEDPQAPSDPGHLVCYRGALVKTEPPQPSFAKTLVSTNNQFGDEVLQANAPAEICLPSARLE